MIAAAQALGARVLVVDDGSTDGSGDQARAAGAEVVTLAQNQGKGFALGQGLRWATSLGFTAVLTCDADGQHPPPAIAALAAVAPKLPGHLVLGVRDMRAAPLASRIGRWWTSFGTWAVCGRWPSDNQTGLRIYPLPLAAEVPVRAGRYAYEVESLVRLIWAGAPLHRLTVPVLYPADRISHFRVGRDTLRACGTFLRLFVLRWCRSKHRD